MGEVLLRDPGNKLSIEDDSRKTAMATVMDRVFKGVARASGLLIFVILAMVALFLLVQAWPAILPGHNVRQIIESFSGDQAHSFWQYVAPLVFGTVISAVLALLLAFFVAIGIALFISQYSSKRVGVMISHVVDLLAAIPSVVYGLWGGVVLVPAISPLWEKISSVLGWIPLFAGPVSRPARTVASVAVVLAVMVMPIITSVTRDIFLQTPLLYREAALALGATKWEMIRLSVLPFGRSGMISALMLALGRALGETMAVLMILSPGRTFSLHLFKASAHQTIAANIAAQYPEADAPGIAVLIATGLVLFAITFVVNILARKIGKKVNYAA